MGRVFKTQVAAAVVLLAAGLVACGGGDDSGSTATGAASQVQSTAKPSDDSSSGGSATTDGDKGDSGSGGSGDQAGDFTPKQHEDSGGGSEQLKVKGGDNSVQEFGEEADASEFDQAAAVLHGFLDARAEGNWAATCEYMSKSVVESFEKLAAQAKKVESDSCAAVLEALTNPAAKQALKTEAEQADVRSLRTEGERSFVIYTDASGTVFAMPMTNEDGTWKVASLAGTPLS